jgi:hypothetical protein
MSRNWAVRSYNNCNPKWSSINNEGNVKDIYVQEVVNETSLRYQELVDAGYKLIEVTKCIRGHLPLIHSFCISSGLFIFRPVPTLKIFNNLYPSGTSFDRISLESSNNIRCINSTYFESSFSSITSDDNKKVKKTNPIKFERIKKPIYPKYQYRNKNKFVPHMF